ncbi:MULTISPECIES: hypothetical protein [unclassified Streptomyces]
MVRRPVDGEVHVHHGQIYVEGDPDSSAPTSTRRSPAGRRD